MTSPRIDWISLMVSSHHDHAQQWYAEAMTHWLAEEQRAGRHLRGGWKPQAQFNTSTKERQYYVEIWGEMAHKWLMMNYWRIPGLIVTRLDVRYTLESATEQGLASFVAAAASMDKGRRNVQTFNSKSRVKKSTARNSGGRGLAIGSHKSDKRVSLYKRAGEPVAIECQLQGDFLSKLWGDFMGYDTSEVPFDRQLDALIDQATYLADTWLAESVGIDPANLWAALQSQDGTYLSWEGALTVARVVSQYELLSPQEKRDVRARLAQMG